MNRNDVKDNRETINANRQTPHKTPNTLGPDQEVLKPRFPSNVPHNPQKYFFPPAGRNAAISNISDLWENAYFLPRKQPITNQGNKVREQ